MDSLSATPMMVMAGHHYGRMPMCGTFPSISDPNSTPRMPIVTMDAHGVIHTRGAADLLDRDQQLSSANKRRKIVYLCESCGTSYTEKRALARHKHTNQHRKNLGLPPAQRYPCTTCEKSFSRDHDRVRHENETHKGLKRHGQRNAAESTKTDSPPQSSDSATHSDSLSPSDQDSQNTPASSATTHSRTPSSAFLPNGAIDGSDWKVCNADGQRPRPVGQSKYSRPLLYATGDSSFNTSNPTAHISQSSDLQERSWFVEDSDSEDSNDDSNKNIRNIRNLRNISNNSLDDDDDDDEDDDDENLDRFVHAAMRSTSTATADSAIDMEWSQEREPKFPTIVTYDHRGESNERDATVTTTATATVIATADESRDELAPLSEAPPVPRPRHKHGSVITRRGKAQKVSGTTGPDGAVICVFCKKPFEDDAELLLPHLRAHMDSLKGEHKCKTCDIGFTHRADLDRHKASVDFFGYCGFPFHHSKPCTGHHPPSSRNSTQQLGDRDSVQLFAQLRNWEHAQLRVYIEEVQALLSTRNSRASTCYSVEALFRHSRDSFASTAISINTFDSAPADGDTKRGIGGLQQRLRMMSLRHTPSTAPISKLDDPSAK